MTENDDCVLVQLPAGSESLSNQLGADSLTLTTRQYCHRRKPHEEAGGIALHGDRGKQDMSHRLIAVFGDPGDQGFRVNSQSFDESRFIIRLEGRGMERENSWRVLLRLGA